MSFFFDAALDEVEESDTDDDEDGLDFEVEGCFLFLFFLCLLAFFAFFLPCDLEDLLPRDFLLLLLLDALRSVSVASNRT